MAKAMAPGGVWPFNVPMRRRRPQPLLVLAFVMLMGVLMYVQKLPTREPVTGLKMASGRLSVYYTEHPPGPGWSVRSIAIQGRAVWVDLGFPKESAGTIQDALRARCPINTDAAWSVLLKTQDIEVRGLANDGKVIAAISCRALQNGPIMPGK